MFIMAYNDWNRSGGGKGGGNRNFNAKESVREKFSFPSDYLSNGYNDSEGKQSLKYIIDYSKKIGEELSKDKNTGKSKIREYYDNVVAINQRYVSGSIDLTRAKVELGKLIPRVENRVSKGTASVTFRNFISKNVKYVTSDDSTFKYNLRCFMEHFEAVVCYVNDGGY